VGCHMVDISVSCWECSVLYGRETWSLMLRAEHRLSVFKNRVLSTIFGPTRDDVTGG
jgi:hypothetical protein